MLLGRSRCFPDTSSCNAGSPRLSTPIDKCRRRIQNGPCVYLEPTGESVSQLYCLSPRFTMASSHFRSTIGMLSDFTLPLVSAAIIGRLGGIYGPNCPANLNARFHEMASL